VKGALHSSESMRFPERSSKGDSAAGAAGRIIWSRLRSRLGSHTFTQWLRRSSLDGRLRSNCMIPKRLEDIAEDDLIALIEDQVREGRTIDYKRELPRGDDKSKKEFLADVSSFANTSGGDLIYGMDEEEALPTEIVGLQSGDLDKERQRLESIMASGLEPRIRYEVRDINCADDKIVLVLRIDRSWSGPHRVVFQQSDRFWGRNSSGKYPLDVNELRAAFTLSSTVLERIRAFRTDRIIAISNNETPVPMNPGPKMVMHCIPIESFAGQPQYNVIPFLKNRALRAIGNKGYCYRLNLDGLLVGDGQGPYIGDTYTHLYRNGLIEAVTGPGWVFQRDNQRWIASAGYEKALLDYLPVCFHVFKEIGASTPIVVALTLTNVQGLAMSIPASFILYNTLIDRQTLTLPESVVEGSPIEPVKILKPMFDLVWNACGYEVSMNFDKDGRWVGRGY